MWTRFFNLPMKDCVSDMRKCMLHFQTPLTGHKMTVVLSLEVFVYVPI